MNITDRIYGDATITEPVLLELMQSAAVERLKYINQAGASQYVLPDKTVSRYEHSAGVMLLLKRLGASLEEQIAGLLHDVSHTAFSHVADFVYRSAGHVFHETIFDRVIRTSTIPQILARHNIRLAQVLDVHRFMLLERDIPDLCADRVDYFLRDMAATYNLPDVIQKHLQALTVVDHQIMLSDPRQAHAFARDYLMLDRTRWSAPMEVAAFQILADAITIALELGILTEEDWLGTDEAMFTKLQNANHEAINVKLALLNPSLRIKDDSQDYDFHSRNKVRFIDPLFIDTAGQLMRVSERFPEFKTQLAQHQALIARGVYVKILSS